MRSSIKYRRRPGLGAKASTVLVAVGAILMIGGTDVVADSNVDDAYLNSLEEEVGSLTVPSEKAEKTSETDDLAVKSFERKLRAKYAGSYQFYAKLGDEDKLEAYKEYENTEDLSAASDKVFDLFFHVARRDK